MSREKEYAYFVCVHTVYTSGLCRLSEIENVNCPSGGSRSVTVFVYMCNRLVTCPVWPLPLTQCMLVQSPAYVNRIIMYTK